MRNPLWNIEKKKIELNGKIKTPNRKMIYTPKVCLTLGVYQMPIRRFLILLRRNYKISILPFSMTISDEKYACKPRTSS
jgi:hypothetical protein